MNRKEFDYVRDGGPWMRVVCPRSSVTLGRVRLGRHWAWSAVCPDGSAVPGEFPTMLDAARALKNRGA